MNKRTKLTDKMNQIDTKVIPRERRLSKEEIADRSEDLANVVLEIRLTEETFADQQTHAKKMHKAELSGLESKRDGLATEVSKKREDRSIEARVVVDAESRKVLTLVPTESGGEALEAGLLEDSDIEWEIIETRTARADELQPDLL